MGAEIVVALLTGSVVTAAVNQVGQYLRERKDRKEKKMDGAAASDHEEIQNLKSQMGVVVESQRVLLRDRILHLGMAYIKEQRVTPDARDNLCDMHRVYHKSGGNGHLDEVMRDVMELPLKL